MAFAHFISGIMPESGSPVQQSITIIETRPYRNGWQCFEAPGVAPYWTGGKYSFCSVNFIGKVSGQRLDLG